MSNQFVLGLVFNDTLSHVLLARKRVPYWQEGLLNGIWGDLVPNIHPMAKVNQLVSESVGINLRVRPDGKQWHQVARVNHTDNNITVFATALPMKDLRAAESKTMEPLLVASVADLGAYNLVENLKWLIPMSIYHLSVATFDRYSIIQINAEDSVNGINRKRKK